MSILYSNNIGVLISHHKFCQVIYRNTVFGNCEKNFEFDPNIFEIVDPFKRKKEKKYCNGDPEIDFIEKMLVEFLPFIKDIIDNKTSLDFHRNTAKLTASKMYCEEMQLQNVELKGANNLTNPLVAEFNGKTYIIPNNSEFYAHDVGDIRKYLKNRKFDFILLDPPWWNKYIRRKRKHNVSHGYKMMFNDQLLDIPVNELLGSSGLVAVWCTNSQTHIKFIKCQLFPSWGLQFVSEWYWIKVTLSGEPVCPFSQPGKKQPFERILFGVRPSCVKDFPSPSDKRIIVSVPSAIHSHKPPLIEVLKDYLPPKPTSLEIFARYLLPHFVSYGDEVLKLQNLELYKEVISE